jgi:hypothetical protein
MYKTHEYLKREISADFRQLHREPLYEDLIQMCGQQSNIDSDEINFDLTTYTTSLSMHSYHTKRV